MHTLWQDVRYGLRMLAKSPGISLAAVVMLALGIGANTALFSTVKSVLLNSLPYQSPERLVTLIASDTTSLNPENVSYGKAKDWRERNHVFGAITLYRGWRPTLTGKDKAEVLRGDRVSYDFFPTLGITPIVGREFEAEEDRPDRWHEVLLSYEFWKGQFGGRADVVGETIYLDQTPFQIVGVLPENFRPLLFSYYARAPQVWAPLGYDSSLPNACRTCEHLRSVARLKDGVPVEEARAEMARISANLKKEFPKDYGSDEVVLITPLAEQVVGKVRTTLLVLLAATGLVLLIACANVASLMLSRAAVRQREFAVRAALGATRWQLARQMISELMLLTLIGGVSGVFLANWGIEAIRLWGPADLPRLSEISVDTGVLWFTLVTSIVTGVLAGLVPALQAARADERESLQSGGRGIAGMSRGRLRSMLVVSELAMAFVLAIATGLLMRSLERLVGVHPGFETRDLQTMYYDLIGPKYEKDEAVVEFERRSLEKFRNLPGVQHAALVSTLPLGGSYDQRALFIQGRLWSRESDAPSVDTYYVSEDYIETMQIPLLRGRSFTGADVAAGSGATVALISESAARQFWPGEEPLGKRIQLGGHGDKLPWATIVGITGDVRQYGLDTQATADAYIPFTHDPFSAPAVVIRSSLSTTTLANSVEEELAKLDKGVPVYGAASMESLIGESLSQRRFAAGLVGGFGVLAFLLATIGIYGVMAYGVAQRTSEFGVRLAIGAQARDVLQLVLLGGLRLTMAGIGCGIVAALMVTRLMKSLLYEVSPQDPLTLAAAALLLSAVALMACWLPAWKATRVDPMVALRYE